MVVDGRMGWKSGDVAGYLCPARVEERFVVTEVEVEEDEVNGVSCFR